MKIIGVLSALLLLASCGEKKAVIFTPPDDSTPIIIGDGSVRIKRNKSFDKADKKHASAKHTDFVPWALGYKCDLGPTGGLGSCDAAITKDCSNALVAGCRYILANLKHSTVEVHDLIGLRLVAKFTWNDDSPKKTDIELPNNYSEQGDDLQPSSFSVTDAILTDTVSNRSLTFPCSDLVAPQTCVSIGYATPATTASADSGRSDSSPIIISDGSVKIHRDTGFDVKTGSAASAGHGNKKPSKLWYKCGDSTGVCSAAGAECQPNHLPGCYRTVQDNDKLEVYDGVSAKPVATLQWNGNKTDITTPHNFVHDSAGGNLVVNPNQLLRIVYKHGGPDEEFFCKNPSAPKNCVIIQIE